MITFTLTFDHRVVDGIYACGFLRAIQSYLEKDYGRDTF